MKLLAVLATGAAFAGNPADRLLNVPIDPPEVDPAVGCLREVQPGARALRRWLARHVRGHLRGIVRCQRLAGREDYSLHSEGRAVDWSLDATVARQRREADRLVRMLLATDLRGNRAALARRMGLQEIIWNCGAWRAGERGMSPYAGCKLPGVDATTAHTNHVHLGLNWAGALRQTTFWRHARTR